LKNWQIDLVYTNSSVTPLGAMLASQLKCRHVWHLREFCDLHYGFQYDFGKWWTQATIRRADALVAISKAMAHYYTGGAEWSHMHLIYNGVLSRDGFDILYKECRAKPSSTGQYSFAMIGKLCAAKGQETAVRALALLKHDFPQARLSIAGEGEMEPLIRLANELGIGDKVSFLGYVSDPYQVYRQADTLLMCSRYEAMGRVTAEAMSACLPVIGYDQAGTSEIIEHERTGLLYRGGPAELASCMRRFLEQPEWAEQLGKNGWDVARSRFCIQDYAERIHNVLLNLLQRKASS
jgi:glycosyltransferase involved in cell wall biosynthesis